MTDAELLSRLIDGSLVWACYGEFPEQCFVINGDSTEQTIPIFQAERLYQRGLIELPIPEALPGDMWPLSFHWRLTKGKTR